MNVSNVVIAIVAGLMYFIGTSRIGYGLSQGATDSPILYGLIFGLLYGDVTSGLIIGGTIQMMYLGLIATGGNIPADEALAGIVAIPIALQTGMSVEVAVAVAVPFGVLGVFLDQVRRTTNTFWIHKADEYAKEGNDKGIYHMAVSVPLIVAFFLRFIPVFLITLLGAEPVQNALEIMPEFILNGLTIAGGVLPAMGFALIILTIGKRTIMPYFFLGFFLVGLLNLTTMGAAIFGVIIAFLVYWKGGVENYA